MTVKYCLLDSKFWKQFQVAAQILIQFSLQQSNIGTSSLDLNDGEKAALFGKKLTVVLQVELMALFACLLHLGILSNTEAFSR